MADKDNEMEVLQGRMDERLKIVEQRLASLDTRIWGAVVLILAYVGNKILGLLTIGGGAP
jgi:hypothetical protein